MLTKNLFCFELNTTNFGVKPTFPILSQRRKLAYNESLMLKEGALAGCRRYMYSATIWSQISLLFYPHGLKLSLEISNGK